MSARNPRKPTGTQFRQAVPDPTPEELAQMCAAIQAEWDEKEEISRRVTKPKAWLPPGLERHFEKLSSEPAAPEAYCGRID